MIAPAFRFQGVWRQTKLFPDPEHCTVLIALALQMKHVCAILHLVLDSMEMLEHTNFRWWVKLHPASNFQQIQEHFGDPWPENFILVEGDINEYVEQADVIIGDGFTSVCLESLAKT